jgi:hypothetical protein
MSRKTELLGPRLVGTALPAGVVLLVRPEAVSAPRRGRDGVLVATFAWAFGTLTAEARVGGGRSRPVEMATGAVVSRRLGRFPMDGAPGASLLWLACSAPSPPAPDG